MKHGGLWLALLALVAGTTAQAQVTVEVVMSQEQFLINEAIPVGVRIVNRSGQTLHFGPEPWVSFSVETKDGYISVKSSEPPADKGFELANGKAAMQTADLEPFFTLGKSGHYTVIATVKLKDLKTEISSRPAGFDLIQGIKLWEQSFGLPEIAGETRKYILQKASYRNRSTMYFRLTDATESKVFRVMPIGPMVSFSDPQTQLDGRNNLHLIYAQGARSFNYTVFSPDGELLVRQTHFYTDAPPRIRMDASGNVAVVGGARRFSSEDVPSPKPKVPVNTGAPASTNR